ncbi:hypothetical protein EMCRGX_G017171 [Ephydatia muelleri]
MAVHGNLGVFDRDLEDWASYCERVEQYFIANGISNADRKRAILLSVCGPGTFKLIRNLIAPDKPSDKSFEQIVKAKESESIAQFVAELRRLAVHCEFEGTLEIMLRDRFVCGVRDPQLQKRLLAEQQLTFSKALELAQAFESAESSSRDIQAVRSPSVPLPVHSVEKKGLSVPDSVSCFRCGGKHYATTCKLKSVTCNNCGKTGHIAKVCRSNPTGAKSSAARQKGKAARGHSPEKEDSPPREGSKVHSLYNFSSSSNKLFLQVNGVNLPMEIDTGAAVSILSEATYKSTWSASSRPPLAYSNIVLRAYSGHKLHVLGKVGVNVSFQGKTAKLDLIVVSNEGPTLLGRDWLAALGMDINSNIHNVHSIHSSSLQTILDKHSPLFSEDLGKLKGVTVKLFIDRSVKPAFFKHRPVPFALRQRIEAELDRLEKEGIIEAVRFSDWAAPIILVVKRDGSVRICGDFKLTVNRATTLESYPLPRVDELLASLGKSKVFSKLDLSNAYLQLPVDDESKELLTISTHRGLYRYNRLPFGVASAPAIFQRSMESLLRGIPGVCVFFDDILVSGPSERDHLCNLEKVLSCLEESGLKLKLSKCSFLLSSVEYLGHRISAAGIQPTEDKKKAILQAPAPKNVTQLKSWLGLLNYYSKFLPNLSATLAPLYDLLKSQRSWSWESSQQVAFSKAKELLTSASVLVHYEPDRELVLACDASEYGVGAVLSHHFEEGFDRPIAFASRTLAPAERKYSQLDKEALAIVFGVDKFHQYLYGRHFTILSDHKPLQYLFAVDRPIPQMVSPRVQRWALTLSAFDYTISFRAGKLQGNADALSRLPLQHSPEEVPTPGDMILLLEALDLSEAPISAAAINKLTGKDPVLSRVRSVVQHGTWDSLCSDSVFQPYKLRRLELSVQDGCVLWGSRVVVPQVAREAVIKILHEAHPGISRMKSLARGIVWVHVDFAGPFLGKQFIILVDASTKWLEVGIVASPSSQQAVKFLRSVFSTHGLPDILVSDNGSAFSSSEFEEFVKRNGFRHIRVAPYHPASNGAAERAVQTLKKYLSKTRGDLETRLSRFLFQYRLTPHTSTGSSPAELLFGRRPKSHLDFIHPDLSARVTLQQERQHLASELGASIRAFLSGDKVYVRNFTSSSVKWLPGVVTSLAGPRSVRVALEDGTVVRRHFDHVKFRVLPPPHPDQSSTVSTAGPSAQGLETSTTCTSGNSPDAKVSKPLSAPVPTPAQLPKIRRSSRIKNAPQRF